MYPVLIFRRKMKGKENMAKKIIAWLLVVVLTAGVAIGGTLAYLTDRDSEANVFTVGNVDITLEEEFEQNSQLKPGVGINKDVQIKNEGPNAAWVWYTYAVPANLDEYLEVTFAENTAWQTPIELGVKAVGDEEIEYKYYLVRHNAPVAAGITTAQSMDAVTLSGVVDVAPNGDLYAVVAGETTALNWNLSNDHIIYVDAYAIQTEGLASVEAACEAFQQQWGIELMPSGSTITVTSADELAAALSDPDLAPGTIIDGSGVTVEISNNEHYQVPGGVTLKNVTYNNMSRGGDYFIIDSGAGEKAVFENCIFSRSELGSLIIGAESGGSDLEFNNCTFYGPVFPNFVEKPDGKSVFNNCTFKVGSAFMKQGYVNCMGGTHTFVNCTFDYTGGNTSGSNQYVRYNAVNSYSESYSTAVILEGCSFTNCATQKYGSNSTLTVK